MKEIQNKTRASPQGETKRLKMKLMLFTKLTFKIFYDIEMKSYQTTKETFRIIIW